jgi:two-component system nitrogen regulation response regulator NtrX
VRELKNHVERLMIMSDADVLDAADVDGGAPAPIAETGPVTVRGGKVVDAASAGVWERLVGIGTLQEFQDETEKLFLVAKLADNGGNVTRTAEAIDTPRSNLYKKIDRYGLRRDREGGEA